MTHVFREWIRPNFLPQSVEVAIDRARTRRTVATSAESVKVQREIVISQAQWLAKVLDAQRDGNALLRNVSDDLALLVDAIQMSVQGFAKFADRVDQRLADQQERLASIERFSQYILDGIERSVRIQEQQLKIQNDQLLTLGRIESLLTSPEATKVREQLQLAMARYRRGLDSSNRDSADDLDDALRLFEGIVSNSVGNQIHGVWYHLGILYESHAKDLRKALAAYKSAQRLAADLDDKDGIYLDSVMSLCQVYYRLLDYAEAYSRIIGLVQRYPGHTGVAFDAARYCAVTGREAECFAFLRQCLAKDRLFYVKILCDADFAALPGFDAFIATLIAEAKAEVLPDLLHLEKTLAVAERALCQYDLSPLEDYRKKRSALISELNTGGYLGAPKVQADVRRLNNSLVSSAEQRLRLALTGLHQSRSENESKRRVLGWFILFFLVIATLFGGISYFLSPGCCTHALSHAFDDLGSFVTTFFGLIFMFLAGSFVGGGVALGAALLVLEFFRWVSELLTEKLHEPRFAGAKKMAGKINQIVDNDSKRKEDERIAKVQDLAAELADFRMPEPGAVPA